MALSAEGVDEIWNEIFFGGTGLEDFFFVFDDDFVIGDFDDFFARDDEFGIHDAFHDGTFDDDLLDQEAIGIDSVVDDLTEFGTFLGLNFEREEIEIEV